MPWLKPTCRFICHGSAEPPMSLDPKDRSKWPSPDSLNNPHEPMVIESSSIRGLDLGNVSAAKTADRVLILTPLRDAAAHLETHFALLSALTYSHQNIDLAFLVGDCTDQTLSILQKQLRKFQDDSNPSRFRSAMIVEKDFGDTLGQSVEERHSFKAQGTRRRAIGK